MSELWCAGRCSDGFGQIVEGCCCCDCKCAVRSWSWPKFYTDFSTLHIFNILSSCTEVFSWLLVEYHTDLLYSDRLSSLRVLMRVEQNKVLYVCQPVSRVVFVV